MTRWCREGVTDSHSHALIILMILASTTNPRQDVRN
jgi:hypothetical protein